MKVVFLFWEEKVDIVDLSVGGRNSKSRIPTETQKILL